MENLEFIVSESCSGIRLDMYLCEELIKFSRNKISGLIDSGDVKVNDIAQKKGYIVRAGDKIIVNININSIIFNKNLLKPMKLDLCVVYEDQDLIIINKSKGMIVHPIPGHVRPTLVNALIFHRNGQLSNLNGNLRPGIVHRLDKDTSGLLIIAKNNKFHKFISEQIKQHNFIRKYEAIVCGIVRKDFGIICNNIARNSKIRTRMQVINENLCDIYTKQKAKFAVTYFKVIKRFFSTKSQKKLEFTHIELELKTGRTHQIRAHMQHMGHALIGDITYGSRFNFDFYQGQCLCAKSISFWHPYLYKHLRFSIELPEYFKKSLLKISGL
ncbi:MAG: RluA family pseudouridine synthase [Candidatus Improbicoccus devescovinae]|nr:MAG: RluA family pseudouridine synthase [Candidatus Improbicoccus devescovinae]